MPRRDYDPHHIPPLTSSAVVPWTPQPPLPWRQRAALRLRPVLAVLGVAAMFAGPPAGACVFAALVWWWVAG